jgi:hypothetical protein
MAPWELGIIGRGNLYIYIRISAWKWIEVCLWVCYIGDTCCGRDYRVRCMLFLLYGHVEMGIFYQAGYDVGQNCWCTPWVDLCWSVACLVGGPRWKGLSARYGTFSSWCVGFRAAESEMLCHVARLLYHCLFVVFHWMYMYIIYTLYCNNRVAGVQDYIILWITGHYFIWQLVPLFTQTVHMAAGSASNTLFPFAMSRGPRVLIQHIELNIRL